MSPRARRATDEPHRRAANRAPGTVGRMTEAERAVQQMGAVPGIEQGLRLQAIRSAWRLRKQHQVGLVVLGSGRVGAASIANLQECVAGRATGWAGISHIYRELVDTARFVTLAHVTASTSSRRATPTPM